MTDRENEIERFDAANACVCAVLARRHARRSPAPSAGNRADAAERQATRALHFAERGGNPEAVAEAAAEARSLARRNGVPRETLDLLLVSPAVRVR